MSNRNHINKSLKSFCDVFERLTWKHSAYTLFDNFLEMCVCTFSLGKMENRFIEIKEKYSDKDMECINQLLAELLKLYKDCDTWADPLGEFYEGMSLSKTSGFSQFFTPNPICEMMARCTNSEVTEKKLATILEPCSGSGRMLLACNYVRKNPLDYFAAMDLDRTCVLMTAINMLFHGITGEVVWKDALSDSDWREGFIINPHLRQIGIPSIQSLAKENSLIWLDCQQRTQERERKEAEAQANYVPTKKEKIEALKKAQSILF